MNKSIETWREELQEKMRISVEETARTIANCHEEIIIAFIAKYGLQPQEVVTCYEGNKFWVEKKDREHKSIEFIKKIANLEGDPTNFRYYLVQQARSLLKEIGSE